MFPHLGKWCPRHRRAYSFLEQKAPKDKEASLIKGNGWFIRPDHEAHFLRGVTLGGQKPQFVRDKPGFKS